MALLAAAPVHGDSGRPFQSIEWRQGRLSVDVDRVPIGELLTAVAGTTGVEVRGLANVDGTVSIHFANRSLRDGLSALLNRFNYAMIDEPATGDDRERIVVIVVGPKSDLDAETARAQPRRRRAASICGRRSERSGRLSACAALGGEARRRCAIGCGVVR